MRRAARLGALLLLATLAGCTTGATVPGAGASPSGSPAAGAGSVVAADNGSDVGNGRPRVTHDGLMVRHRVVIAILSSPGADVVALRHEVDRAAAARHTTLSDISPSVLDPADQENLAPDLTVVLPAGATEADAEALIDPAGTPGEALPGVQRFEVASVLVHDLRFTVRAPDPAALTASLAREGILADALGSYSTASSHGRLEVTYTGPLLSDDLVEAVRRGIARGEGGQPSSVTVLPRSTTGVGVVLAQEPSPAPVVQEDAAPPPAAGHDHGSALAATVTSRGPWWSNLWVIPLVAVALGLAGWLGLGLGLVRTPEEADAD